MIVGLMLLTATSHAAIVSGKQGGSWRLFDNTESLNVLEVDSTGIKRNNVFSVKYDEFLGDAIPDEYAATTGTSSSTVVTATILSNGVGGVVQIGSGSEDAGYVANGSQINLGQLNYKTNQGGIVAETRVKVSDATTITVFFGFTDSTALEYPLHITAGTSSTIAVSATDAFGLIYDPNSDPDYWYCAGVSEGVTTTALSSGVAASTSYQTLRVAADASGNGTCYVDEALVGTVGSAVNTTATLTPIIAVGSRGTDASTLDIDYIQLKQKR